MTTTLLGTQTFNTTSGTHTVVATPAVGDLIIIIRANTGNTTSTTPTDTQSGTYTKITSALKATSVDLMEVYVRNQLITSATSTTFSDAAGTTTGGGIAVLKVTGVATAGATAIRQSHAQANQAASGTPTPVFSSAALTTSTVIGAVFNATSPATMTPRTGYTELFDVGYSTPTTGLEIMARDTGETGTSIAWGGTSASAFCSIAIEVWSQSSPTVALNTPADAATGISTTPTLNFTGTDTESDSVEYNIQLSDTVPVAFYKLDSTANDEMGAANGTATGVTYQAGKLNNGAKFGSGAYIVATNAIGSLSNLTISLWVKASFTNSTEKYVCRDFGGGTDWAFYVGQDSTGKYAVGVKTATSNWHEFLTTAAISTSGFVHLVLTYDGTTAKVYVNGTLDSSNTYTDALVNSANKDIRIGCLNPTTQTSTALIDELGIWNYAFTTTDIATVYNSGNAISFPYFINPSIDKVSTTDAGFTAGHPFTSGVAKDFTVQAGDTLTSSTTYYWRVRAIDPTGSNTYGAWATMRSFTTTSGSTTISITKSLQYAINKQIAATKSLKYDIKLPTQTITKSLKYGIKKPISLTKSLQYTVKKSPAITKSLKYTVKTTPAAKTLSLKYDIKLPTQTLTKSLQYTVKKANSQTKSLVYAVKKTRSLTATLRYDIKLPTQTLTRSLQYTIKKSIVVTKSLQYTVVIPVTTRSITKSLQYGVKKTRSVTQSLQYEIKRPQSLTKTLKYTVKKVRSLTQSLKYDVKLPTQTITKSLQYAVRKSIAVTSSLAYEVHPKTQTVTDDFTGSVVNTTKWTVTGGSSVAIVANQLQITTTASTTNYYDIHSAYTQDMTGSYVYANVVNAGNQALASLEAILHVGSVINNKVVYWSINGNTLYVKQYDGTSYTNQWSTPYNSTTHAYLRIREASGTTYFDTSPNGTTWTQQYSQANLFAMNAVSILLEAGTYASEASATTVTWDNFNTTAAITTSSITKSLQYAIRKQIAVTQSLKYTVRKPVSITKPLRYDIKLPTITLTKSLQYEVKKLRSLTSSLKYTVKKPVSLTQSLKYTIKITKAAITKSLVYDVRKVRSITQSLQYEIKKPQSITKSLQYTIRKTRAITASLKYDIKLPTVALTKALTYDIKKPISITKSVKYTIKIPNTISKQLIYEVRKPRAITKSLIYSVKKSQPITKSLVYSVVNNSTAGFGTFYFGMVAFGRDTYRTYYTFVRPVTKSLKYTIKQSPAITKSLKYALFFRRQPITKSLTYHLSTNWHDTYQTKGTAFGEKYTVKNTTFSEKYNAKGTNFSEKFAAKGTGWVDKFVFKATSWTNKE